MRREGRQHGWVYAVDRSLVDPEGKPRRRAVPVDGASVANGGFVRAPRKPTNHSKPAIGRAYKNMGSGTAGSSGKGMHKFKHDAAKTYCLELEGVYDAAADAMREFDRIIRQSVLEMDLLYDELDGYCDSGN